MRSPLRPLLALWFAAGPLACTPTSTDNSGHKLADHADHFAHWFVDADGQRVDLTLLATGGSAIDESDGRSRPIDRRTFDRTNPGTFSFRVVGVAQDDWYRVSVVDGVLRGRIAHVPSGAEPAAGDYLTHVKGWSPDVFDASLYPRVFELIDEENMRARVRIDRAPGAAAVGRIKRYASLFIGASAEETEGDVRVDSWDGKNLTFTRPTADGDQQWSGIVTGRTIAGTVRRGAEMHSFSGERAEVLTHGLVARTTAARDSWQHRTRRRIEHLMMASAPAPLSQTVTVVSAGGDPTPVFELPAERDDAASQWPTSYTTSEVRLDHLLPDPNGGVPLARSVHARMMLPTAPTPAGGWPALIAVNGHNGSARLLLDPDDEYYWYAESFARRGYVVLAVDISHRPLQDRAGLYSFYLSGDDPAGGNGPHPAIRADGFDSDFEEDGERVWDVLRAHDYLRTLPFVDATHVSIAGLSLGGEIATLVGALDPALSTTLAAGFRPTSACSATTATTRAGSGSTATCASTSRPRTFTR